MRLLKRWAGRTVSVHLDGATVRGLVTDVAGDAGAPQDATAFDGASGEGVDLPGPVVIPVANIVWAVVLP